MKKTGKERYILLVLIGIVLLSGIVTIVYKNLNNSIILSGMVEGERGNLTNSVERNEQIESGDNGEDIKEKKLIVHITGEVINPGVYKLSEDERVTHAIDAAGGKTSVADVDSINLAAPVNDGDKIYIPSIVDTINNDSKNNLGKTSGNSVNNGKVYSGSAESDKVDVNRANSEELQQLSGIGPSKAENIINYREENGRFERVDELLDVPGIGEKTLEKIEDSILIR
ncbi:MAG: helix-hairpin-helix domain-containing protein [Halanaerobiaceae bacterium]